ncbi:class II aldolase/adducin family protein (plasmid) [Bradyrhizobium sp. 62B]|uniref:class II aldolase/adducin family protein n=1 Tax=Bradyrhizobium sp. 62B TaxID=2898442 RepID=UPI00255839EF|nr:class II aldolase/adducin family protein [Bradyrhizobium sp. 62B]
MNKGAHNNRVNMTDAEWQVRCDLAAMYRMCDLYGWTDSIYTHLSIRVPDEPHCFLINNYGDLFSEVTASSLVKMDLEGNVYTDSGAFNPAGLVIHSGIYRARPDVNCVIHTHSLAGTGVSTLKNGLRPISQDVLEIYGELAYHEYGSIRREEGDALGLTSQNGDCLILRNHGLLTVGATHQAALLRMYLLSRACEVEVIARGLGEEPAAIVPGVVEEFVRHAKIRHASSEWGMIEWRAAVRQIENRNTDWRQ